MISETIVITDIGSTTTKAILLKKQNDKYLLLDYETAQTSVEKPFEDVKIGIFRALKKLEQKTNILILNKDSIETSFTIDENINYLTTSSAGGGLQILVIGLTKFDSAASAQKAAYGVGGVLLDTMAIDDGRSFIEKMHLFDTLHPDIILFCGGVDGGALFSVYRLAELLKLSNPKLKFSNDANNESHDVKSKIPLVFAGNKEAVEFITTVFSQKFDLYCVPNLRPNMQEENLSPASDKIHELFMNNVMEQAPGYSQVKKLVYHPIIPTPKGVLNTLNLLSLSLKQNILAFDIGGATTDVFSNVLGKFYRTVSANFGMSYSIGNVLAESKLSDVMTYFKIYFDNKETCQTQISNYIGNKILYPDQNPTNEFQTFIEHILAIQAVKLSRAQHFQMHFKTKKLGFLDNLKNKVHRDKFIEKMYYPSLENKDHFNITDIKIMIAAGGVISHATPNQAVFMTIEGLEPKGITEIWRDKHFISPHLGKLAQIAPEIAEQLIKEECFEKLVLYIRPSYLKYKDNKPCMTLISEDNISVTVTNNQVLYLDSFINSNIKIVPEKHVILDETFCNNFFEVKLPILIDCRNPEKCSPELLLKALNPYSEKLLHSTNSEMNAIKLADKTELDYCDLIYESKLPYEGQIYVNNDDCIEPGLLLGENKFEPPKISVVLISSMIGKTISEEEIREGLQVKEHDTVTNGQMIFIHKMTDQIFITQNVYYSPVRGIIEHLNYSTGTLIIREIQDYPLKPVYVDICKKLSIQAKNIKGYMKKRLGDFVYSGEILAVNAHKNYKSVVSPYTGTIQAIDIQKGRIKICYDKEPYKLIANVYGKVVNSRNDKEISLAIKAIKINGKIGFGKENGAFSMLWDKKTEISKYKNHIVLSKEIMKIEDLRSLAEHDIKGLVCPLISYPDIKEYIAKDIGVALTGGESLAFPLIILNGFSSENLEYHNLSWMQEYEGHYINLNPRTQIRAGVSRPEIFIFEQTKDEAHKEKWC